MVFLSLPKEVDTTPLVLHAWQDGKRVLAPKVNWEQRRMLPIEIVSLTDNISEGAMGLREPAEGSPFALDQIDLARVDASVLGLALGIGMLLASPTLPPLPLLAYATVGIALVAGAAAAINCLVERTIDAVEVVGRRDPGLARGDDVGEDEARVVALGVEIAGAAHETALAHHGLALEQGALAEHAVGGHIAEERQQIVEPHAGGKAPERNPIAAMEPSLRWEATA